MMRDTVKNYIGVPLLCEQCTHQLVSTRAHTAHRAETHGKSLSYPYACEEAFEFHA